MSFYNYLIDYTLTETAPVTEPVTLTEAKNYCRVTTTADDTLITTMITEARQVIEKVAGLSLVPKTAVVYFKNSGGNFSLPYGPIKTISELYDIRGTQVVAPSQYLLVGTQYPTLVYPTYELLRATYTTGFDVVPNDLKIAILDQVNYSYENRGVDSFHYDNMGICEKAMRACQRWSRVSPIL